MKARAEIVVSGVAVCIDMDHAERPISGNSPQDWQRDRMITADRQRRYASRMNGSEEGGDFGERPLQLEGPFDPGVSQIGDADEVEGRHAGRLIDLADERRLVADVARAMARAWAVGDATVERHADEADVDLIEPHAVGEAEEGGNSAIARLQLRIGQFRIAPNLLHHAEAPFGKDLPVVNAPPRICRAVAGGVAHERHPDLSDWSPRNCSHLIGISSASETSMEMASTTCSGATAAAMPRSGCSTAWSYRPGSHGHVFGNKVIFQPATEIMMERALARWVR